MEIQTLETKIESRIESFEFQVRRGSSVIRIQRKLHLIEEVIEESESKDAHDFVRVPSFDGEIKKLLPLTGSYARHRVNPTSRFIFVLELKLQEIFPITRFKFPESNPWPFGRQRQLLSRLSVLQGHEEKIEAIHAFARQPRRRSGKRIQRAAIRTFEVQKILADNFSIHNSWWPERATDGAKRKECFWFRIRGQNTREQSP